jgi:hypothetical protein
MLMKSVLGNYTVRVKVKGKKKSGPVTRHGGVLGERRYSSYSFLTSALEWGEWSASRPGRSLPRGKNPVPILYEAVSV